MKYFEVIPASSSFHGTEALTYCSDNELVIGQLVKIRLRNASVFGIVAKKTQKPGFKTAEIEEILEGLILPKYQLGLIDWMSRFYPAPLGSIAQLFAPSFLQKAAIPGKTDQNIKLNDRQLPRLTDEQSAAYRAITKDKKNNSFLVHGATGSGKTRLYIELAMDVIAKKQSVLILTPEISLTAPIARQFQDVFGDLVIINHSSLTPKQRATSLGRLFHGDTPHLVIGPRSSLFMPINDIGLIVVDEFHEPAYKQESQPFYHANRVASMLAKLASAKLVFGSATPPLTDYYLAEQKNVPIIELKKQAITNQEEIGKIEVINLLDPQERSPHPLISKSLIQHLSEVLSRSEQAMVFINKRGSARSISCQDCGHRELCPNCDLPLVYHGDQHLMRCHTCGFATQPPAKCPECGSFNIYFSSPGTKAVADQLSKLFPNARIARFDKDNKKAERLENRYQEVTDKVDIIVGTQLVAKGHDLPRLSLVAMLLADSSLDFPDYSSSERAYQLIRQLAGRVNRGHRSGTFLLQTFAVDSEFIQTATTDSWHKFYSQEMLQRRKYGFPPYYSALKIESARANPGSAQNSLNNLLNKLITDKKGIEILGPSPSFVEKKSSKWHWQLLIKAKDRSKLVDIARRIPSTFKADIDPNNFL